MGERSAASAPRTKDLADRLRERLGGDGKARAEFVTDSFRVRQLVAGDGSAIMIHSGRDNLANIPTRYESGTTTGPDGDTLETGDSGSRVACGVVQRKRH